MEKALEDLGNVPGVFGSFVTDADGNLLASKMPAGYSADMLAKAGQTASLLMRGIAFTRNQAITQVEWEYNEYRLIARQVASGIISVLCEKTLSLALLKLTFNVVVQRIATLLEQGAIPENKPQVAQMSRKNFDAICEAVVKKLRKVYGPDLAKSAMRTAVRKFELIGEGASVDDVRIILLPTMREKLEGLMKPDEISQFLEKLLKEHMAGK